MGQSINLQERASACESPLPRRQVLVLCGGHLNGTHPAVRVLDIEVVHASNRLVIVLDHGHLQVSSDDGHGHRFPARELWRHSASEVFSTDWRLADFLTGRG